MGFPKDTDVTDADEKAGEKLVAASKFDAFTVYEQERQRFRKAGTLEENKGLLDALCELSKGDEVALKDKKKRKKFFS